MRLVRERLFLGDITDAYTVLQSPQPKVTHMLSVLADELLSSEQNFAPGNLCSLVTAGAGTPPPPTIPTGLASPDGTGAKRELVRKTVPLRDMESENLLDHLDSCVEFIEEGRGSGGAVLVHCLAGISRSASVVTAYLMQSEKLPLIDALASLREVSGGVCPNYGFMEQLRMFEGMGFRVDKESPIYKQFHATTLVRVAGCTPGLSWLSFFDHINNRVKGSGLKRSSFMNHVHNVAPPVKGKSVEEGISSKPPSGVAPFRERMARLWRRGEAPQ